MSLQAAIVPQTHSPFLSKEVHNARYPTTTATTVAGRLSALTLPGIMSSLISPDTTAVNVIQLSPTALAEEALRLSRETLNLEIQAYLPKVTGPTLSTTTTTISSSQLLGTTGVRLNKFVRRLHDMLQSEKDSGVVEWRKGLLVLHSTDTFAKQILPKYFNTRNFKTFRRQLNYYGFVHVRSFSTTGSTTTALWVNQDLAQKGSDAIASVLMLKRVEPCESARTAEGRRVRKELAIHTVEEDLGVNAKTLQIEQIRSLANRSADTCVVVDTTLFPSVPMEIQYKSPGAAHSISSASSDDQPAPSRKAALSIREGASAANLLLLLSQK